MSKILFSGVEIPSNRTLLERSGVTNVVLNYWGLRKRGLPKTKAYLVGEHFLPDMKVWLDSGASQADKASLSAREWDEYAADYEEFVAYNYDRIEGWIELDAETFGLPKIIQNRLPFDNDPKMWVVWKESYGVMQLQEWAKTYRNIAIPHDTIEKVTNLASITRALSAQNDVQFHALATAKPDNLRQIPFTTSSTLSWLSPMRRGETIIWDGMKLVRYPKSMKNQARTRYKNVVERAGLDFQKFKDDDTLESTKVAVWSYLQLEASMDKDKPNLRVIPGGQKPPSDEVLVDSSEDTLYSGLMEIDHLLSNNSGSEVRKIERTELTQRDPSEVVSMPVVGYEMRTVVDQENGHDVLKEIPIVKTNATSLRQCDTCFVAANCPAFKPQNTCAFNLPIEVKTPEQLKQLNTAMLEMQAQRVMFMRFAEELNGGYADPNTSQEIDRYQKMLKNMKELDENKEFIQITAQRNASGGVLSAIFGDRVQAMKEQPPIISEEKTTMIIQQNLEQ